MKVKRYYPEYKNWLTEKQWLSKGKVIIDKTKTVTLWSNQFCNVSSVYAAPDNVRDMTDFEKLSYKQERKLQRKLAKERQITRYELEKARQEELDKALKLAEKLREDWHTEFQWRIFYGREIKEKAGGVQVLNLMSSYRDYMFLVLSIFTTTSKIHIVQRRKLLMFNFWLSQFIIISIFSSFIMYGCK